MGVVARHRDCEGHDAMVEAVRDQWLIALAVVVLVGFGAWLWTTRSRKKS
jgi:hypothetical protein